MVDGQSHRGRRPRLLQKHHRKYSAKVTRRAIATRLRANRQTNAYLAPALQNFVVQHAIQTDASEQECNGRKKYRQRRQEPFADRQRSPS